MNKIFKQIIKILILSIIFSLARYIIISQDFSIVKKKMIAKEIDINKIDTLESLKQYILNINRPQKINFDIAEMIFKNNLATFIDARDNDSYNDEHIVGAINMSYDYLMDNIDLEYTKDILKFGGIENFSTFSIGQINNKKIILKGNSSNIDKVEDNQIVFVIYCSGEGCSLSEDLSYYLFEKLSFDNLLIFEGGIPVWKENNMPLN